MRWYDPVLTWDPAEWGLVDMVQVQSNQVWRPDLMLTNHSDAPSVDFASKDRQLVRVNAIRAAHSDLQLFNIEWSPQIKFMVHHEFDLSTYPVDIQTVNIRIESWMSLENKGGIKLVKFSGQVHFSKKIFYIIPMVTIDFKYWILKWIL